MHEITAFAIVKNQTLHYQSYGKLQTSLAVFEGQSVELTIRKKKKYRSSPQNRFYHGVVVPSVKYAMEAKGFFLQSNEAVHELLKFKFLKGEILNVASGELIPTIGSTTRLSTIDFEDYLTQIRAWASSCLDCIIPEPNEQLQAEI